MTYTPQVFDALDEGRDVVRQQGKLYFFSRLAICGPLLKVLSEDPCV